MHLLVESNFLLELILGQKQASACETLLQAAEEGRLALHTPAFSFMEAVYKLRELGKSRDALQKSVFAELTAAERETTDKQLLKKLMPEFTTVLEGRDVRQQERLLAISRRLTSVAQTIELTESVWLRTAELADTTALTLPDAIVAASLLERVEELASTAAGEPVLFASRDSRAFSQNDVKQLFQERGCNVILNFDNARAKLRL